MLFEFLVYALCILLGAISIASAIVSFKERKYFMFGTYCLTTFYIMLNLIKLVF